MRFSTEGVNDPSGVARLMLQSAMAQVGGGYRLAIIPPPSAKAAALINEPYQIQPLTRRLLGTRLAITGVLRGADCRPVAGAAVTARPSLRFLWNLDPELQLLLGEIPPASAVTPESGEFVLFVDHTFESDGRTVWGHYDLTFDPKVASGPVQRQPSWTQTEVELPRADQAAFTPAPAITTLPDAAFVRGHIDDAANALVVGAEVKLYQAQQNPTLWHNSGHFSLDACSMSQFEALVRSICSVPMQEPKLLSPCAMVNHLGKHLERAELAKIQSIPGTKVHVYGKKKLEQRRKMGHVTILGSSADDVEEKIEMVEELIGEGVGIIGKKVGVGVGRMPRIEKG